MRRLAFLGLILVPLASHAAAAQQRDRSSNLSFRDDAAETRTTLSVPVDSAWKVLSVVYAEMGFPLSTSANVRGHEYLSNFMDLRGRLFNKPNAEFFSCQQNDNLTNMTSSGQISFALRTRVVPAGDGASELHTQIDARARRRGTGGAAVECSTTGQLEKMLGQLVSARIAQPAATAAAAPPAP